jgi:hypothetical protein
VPGGGPALRGQSELCDQADAACGEDGIVDAASPGAPVAVPRAAIEAGVNHIDTSDFYGPHITNRLIREALVP